MTHPVSPLLERTRLGILVSDRKDETAIAVPVWFEWDGEVVRCFADRNSKKIGRLKRKPRGSLLVTNDVGEPDDWVAFDGDFDVKDAGGIELAERLAPAYWDLSNPDLKAMLEQWKSAPEAFVLLEMRPERIRKSGYS